MHPHTPIQQDERQPFGPSHAYGQPFDPLVIQRKAEGMERRAYVAGWWWGLASGAICGTCTTALLVVLWRVVANALACPTC